MRPCPLCLTLELAAREPLYSYRLTSAQLQTVFACSCGMIYADGGPIVDYSLDPIYAQPNSIGSGTSEPDRMRLTHTADTIKRSGVPASARILDYGCGQSGLLDALRNAGYTDLTGFDLSPQCMEEVTRRGHHAAPASLNSSPSLNSSFDLIVLSHVLEHVPEPQPFLRHLMSLLHPAGSIYVEVPDAQRYHQLATTLPLLDFNSEHINHMDACSLKSILERVGLFGGTIQEKTIQLTSGAQYPAIWTIARRSRTTIKVAEFVAKSRAQLASAHAKMLHQLSGFPNVIVWGAGEYLAHVLPLLATKRIVQLIDRNPQLWGRQIAGITVEAPSQLLPGVPIVIAAVVAREAIHRDILAAGHANMIVEIELESS